MLANLFLDELGQKAVRYADDFLVLCRSPEAAEEALELTDLVLEGMELDLDRDKTAVASFAGGFDFLGVFFFRDSAFVPLETGRRRPGEPRLPPPLDLVDYLELRHAEAR